MANAVVDLTAWKKWRGKLAGGAAGLALGGPLGALVGMAAGHAYDHYRRALHAVSDAYAAVALAEDVRQNAQEAAFTIGIIALGARLAHMNERLDSRTIETFRTTFGLPERHMPTIRRMFEQALFDRVGFRPYAQQLAQLFAGRPQILEELVGGLVRFAAADGALNETVIDYLDELSRLFGIPAPRFASMLMAQGVLRTPTGMKDAFSVLGVAANAPEIVVKQAYRTLTMEYHPDKLAHHALPAAELAAANDRMASINQAYNEIKRQRGWG